MSKSANPHRVTNKWRSVSNPAAMRPSRFLWEPAYIAVLLEKENARLAERIKAAEEMISTRLTALTNRENHAQELRAIENTLKALNTLRRERLNHT